MYNLSCNRNSGILEIPVTMDRPPKSLQVQSGEGSRKREALCTISSRARGPRLLNAFGIPILPSTVQDSRHAAIGTGAHPDGFYIIFFQFFLLHLYFSFWEQQCLCFIILNRKYVIFIIFIICGILHNNIDYLGISYQP